MCIDDHFPARNSCVLHTTLNHTAPSTHPLQATLSNYVSLFAGYSSVWLHKMRVAQGQAESPEQGYQLTGVCLWDDEL